MGSEQSSIHDKENRQNLKIFDQTNVKQEHYDCEVTKITQQDNYVIDLKSKYNYEGYLDKPNKIDLQLYKKKKDIQRQFGIPTDLNQDQPTYPMSPLKEMRSMNFFGNFQELNPDKKKEITAQDIKRMAYQQYIDKEVLGILPKPQNNERFLKLIEASKLEIIKYSDQSTHLMKKNDLLRKNQIDLNSDNDDDQIDMIDSDDDINKQAYNEYINKQTRQFPQKIILEKQELMSQIQDLSHQNQKKKHQILTNTNYNEYLQNISKKNILNKKFNNRVKNLQENSFEFIEIIGKHN